MSPADETVGGRYSVCSLGSVWSVLRAWAASSVLTASPTSEECSAEAKGGGGEVIFETVLRLRGNCNERVN